MKRTLTATLALTLGLGVAAPALAAGDAAAPSRAAAASVASAAKAQAAPAISFTRIEELLPADAIARARARTAAAGLDIAARDAALARLIDGSQYECGPTGLDGYVDQQIADWTMDDLLFLSATDALNWVTYEALVYQPEGPQQYGVNGEHTKELTKSFQRLQGFWDVDGSDIRMAAMHGATINEDARMLRLLTELYGIPQADAAELIEIVQQYLAQPRFAGGANPLFTLNAFAYSEENAPESERIGIEDKLVMGDGILQAMSALGLGDVAPRGILAHEYGHHVQYELDLFEKGGPTPEGTRTTELEADAMGGYYLSHPRGERLRTKRVTAFVRAYGEVGDCSFDSTGHHGTPNQRAAAATWADGLANAKGAKGHVLPSRTVSERFRAHLPVILAPAAK